VNRSVQISAPAWGKDLKSHQYLQLQKEFLDDLLYNPQKLNRILNLYKKKRVDVYSIYCFVVRAVEILDQVLTTEKIKKKILFGGTILSIKRLQTYLHNLKFGVSVGTYDLDALEKIRIFYNFYNR